MTTHEIDTDIQIEDIAFDGGNRGGADGRGNNTGADGRSDRGGGSDAGPDVYGENDRAANEGGGE